MDSNYSSSQAQMAASDAQEEMTAGPLNAAASGAATARAVGLNVAGQIAQAVGYAGAGKASWGGSAGPTFQAQGSSDVWTSTDAAIGAGRGLAAGYGGIANEAANTLPGKIVQGLTTVATDAVGEGGIAGLEVTTEGAQTLAVPSEQIVVTATGRAVGEAAGDAADVAIGWAERQLSNIARFIRKLPANARGDVQTHRLPNGGVAVQGRSLGQVPGSSATYEKQIDSAGDTINYTKTTYDPAGNIVHVKDKMQ